MTLDTGPRFFASTSALFCRERPTFLVIKATFFSITNIFFVVAITNTEIED